MSGEEDDDLPSFEEMAERILELEDQLKAKEDEIAQLNQASIGRGRRGKGGAAAGPGGDADYAVLEIELKELREKETQDKKLIAKLREDLATANVKVDTLSSERSSFDNKVKALTKTSEDLNKENAALVKRTQEIENQTKAANKQKSANVKMSQQLTDENSSLKEEVSLFFLCLKNEINNSNFFLYFNRFN